MFKKCATSEEDLPKHLDMSGSPSDTISFSKSNYLTENVQKGKSVEKHQEMTRQFWRDGNLSLD